MSTEPTRLLIADDNPAFRQGLRDLLQTVASIAVIDEAATGGEAVVRARTAQPDIVLMDLNMPGTNGIEATRQITTASPHIAVLMLTMFENDDSVLAAIRAGARGYLLKGASRAEIVRGIEAATAGGVIFGPGVARLVLERFSPSAPPPEAPFPQLTTRERDILALVANGLSNAAIAERLTLSPKTVRNHVHSIYRKLHVEGRAEAIVQARDAGLGRKR